jgi:hypothetical protein
MPLSMNMGLDPTAGQLGFVDASGFALVSQAAPFPTFITHLLHDPQGEFVLEQREGVDIEDCESPIAIQVGFHSPEDPLEVTVLGQVVEDVVEEKDQAEGLSG